MSVCVYEREKVHRYLKEKAREKNPQMTAIDRRHFKKKSLNVQTISSIFHYVISHLLDLC